MTTTITATGTDLHVIISDDRMRAWLIIGPPTGRLCKPSRDAVLAALEAAGMAVTDDVESRIRAYLGLFDGGDAKTAEIPQHFLIAVAQPVRQPRAATIDFLGASAGEPGGGSDIESQPSAHVVIVEEGATVGKWIPATPGQPGADVNGAAIEPASDMGMIRIGDGLRQTADGTVIAQRCGRVVLVDETWTVSEAVTLAGDDITGETTRVASHARIVGNLGCGRAVHAGGGVRVDGAIEGGLVVAADDIVVTGGVFGRGEHGGIHADGNVAIRFCDGASVVARGDVDIQNEAINSGIRANGRLRVRTGSIVGGCVHATRGGDVAALGNDVGIPTLVSIGVHPDLLLEARRLDEDVRRLERCAEEMSGRVQPLVANLKRLTPQQKERLATLLQEARGIAVDLEQARRALSDAQAGIATTGPTRLFVRDVLHSGLRFRVGMREACVRKDFRGPLTLESRIVRGVTELVISFENGRSQVLASAESLPDAAWRAIGEQRRS